MLFRSHFLYLAVCLSTARAANDYEYIIVGSGAGGGPLAARLALAGHKTLLIEAGDDQGTNDNYTVPAYSPRATEDPSMSWDFFVRHFKDDEQQRNDLKLTYTCPGGEDYTGLSPPPGCEIKGVLYPRAGTLGGCTAHNALINIYPHKSDFQYLVDLTGDESWSPENMRKYLIRLEAVNYLQSVTDFAGHGSNGWLGVSHTPLNLAVDLQALGFLLGSIFALGNYTGTLINLATALAGDMNADNDFRDHVPAIYQVLLATSGGKRNGPRDFIVSVRDALNPDGTKKYPLDVKLDTHVTRVTFDTTSNPPKATGVEYLEGKYLYRASKRTGSAGPGIPGSVTASREVIVSGGAYNSPQILKLSGVGPAEELKKFGIPVIKDLPGVGTNLQDHYEISVLADTPNNFSALNGCTFGQGGSDPCLDQWRVSPRVGSIYGAAYDSAGFGAAVYYKSTVAANDDFDIMALGGPATFRGYFPNYSVDATTGHNHWSWVVLKAHPRSRAGSVTLRSPDPLDVPYIDFEYFEEGGDEDLQAMYEGIQFARDSYARQPVPCTETLPGPDMQTREQLFEFTKANAWSHHASSTCPIGTDDDPMAVLDSSFRVRGVEGLRVVDASVYPRIPGTFTALSTYLVSEKASDVILADAKSSTLDRLRRTA